MEELLKSLIYIQQNLNAPKDQYNKFGNFKYRSLEGILAAIKPLLLEQNCGIRFQDEVVDHCGRTFLKTTLTFFNNKGQSLTTTAEAEHAADKTGMDSAQITGAASSYARKYCINGLFCIDDSKDADTDEYHNQTSRQVSQPQQATQKRTYTRKSNSPAAQAPQQSTQQPPYQQAYSQQHTPAYLPIAPNDRYAGIKNALNSVTTQDQLVALYNQHRPEVEGNPEIKNLFSQRKQQLINSNAA